MTEFREWLTVVLTIFVPIFTAVNAWYIRKFIAEPRKLRTDVDAMNVRVGSVEKRLDSGEEKFKVLDRKMDDHTRDLTDVKIMTARIDERLSTYFGMKHQSDG